MSNELPPYRREGPCPKCGAMGDDLTTIYQLPLKERQVSMEFECRKVSVEHLDRYCQNCSFRWCEALAVPEAPKAATPTGLGWAFNKADTAACAGAGCKLGSDCLCWIAGYEAKGGQHGPD